MYRLKNQSGNVYKVTDSKQKRDELISHGWVEVAEKPKAAEEKKGKGADKKPKAAEVKA